MLAEDQLLLRLNFVDSNRIYHFNQKAGTTLNHLYLINMSFLLF